MAGVVDVVDPQLQILNCLKVIIQPEALTEGGTGGVIQTLRATQLKETDREDGGLIYLA